MVGNAGGYGDCVIAAERSTDSPAVPEQRNQRGAREPGTGATLAICTTPNQNVTIGSNHAVRGGLHTRYVGVWCYLTSHHQSWKLTEAQVARDLGVGRGFVRSALENIEQ